MVDTDRVRLIKIKVDLQIDLQTKKLTICTCDTPIFIVSVSASLIRTVNQFVFSARALQVVHINWSSTFSKYSTAKTYIGVPIYAQSEDLMITLIMISYKKYPHIECHIQAAGKQHEHPAH